MKIKYSFGLVIMSIVLMACDNSRILDENIDFVNETWYKDSALVFNIEVEDTLAIYNIFINNRITRQYEYSNLYLFIDTEFPNSITIRDTMECVLLDPSGKFLGKGFGSVWSNKIRYRTNIRFPYSGNYKFTIEQAMRDEQLEHILSAGIRIEKAKIR